MSKRTATNRELADMLVAAAVSRKLCVSFDGDAAIQPVDGATNRSLLQ
jgi:hypothetical protein